MKRRTLFCVVLLLADAAVHHPAAAGWSPYAAEEGTLPPRCWVLGASLKNIGTDLPTPAATYTFNGRCEVDYSTNAVGRESTFDKVKVAATIEWTAQGTYQPAQRNTWEDITLKQTYRDRPGSPAIVGTLTGWMTCAKDPWREPEGQPCGAPGYKTAGTVDTWVAQFYGRFLKVPQTSNLSQQQRTALRSEYDAAVKKAQQLKAVVVPVTDKVSSQAFVLTPTVPTVVSPASNQAFQENTPIPIKLTSPKNLNAASYVVNIEKKNSNGTWISHAKILVEAAQAQSAAGYTGFGAGASASQALPGMWRLNAQVSAPKPSGPSAWVEFSVTSTTRTKR